MKLTVKNPNANPNEVLAELITPIGIARFPRLKDPDTKFNADGVYSVDLVLDEEAREALEEKLSAILDDRFDAYVKGGTVKKNYSKASTFFKAEEDKEGDPTGRHFLRLKCNAQFKGRDDAIVKVRPTIVDSAGHILKPHDIPDIGGGSKLRAFVLVRPYVAAKDKVVGLAFRLKSVQIVELITYGDDNPFDQVEDGFVADETSSDFAAAEKDTESVI